MEINVQANIRDATRHLNRVQRKQIPFAASKTLNEIAWAAAKKAAPQEADKRFDKGATDFTRRGFAYNKSNKHNLTAEVYVADNRAGYMRYMIHGGVKKPKRKALLSTTRHTKLNKYGNITRGRLRKMIQDKRVYFAGVPKGFPDSFAGVWERYGRNKRIRKVATFKDSRTYKPLFPFEETTRQVIFGGSYDVGWAPRFHGNLQKALASAKR